MEAWGEGGGRGISPYCHLNLKKDEFVVNEFLSQSSSGMEDKELPDWKLDEPGDDSHEIGTRKKFPLGSSISGGEFTSDDLEE